MFVIIFIERALTLEYVGSSGMVRVVVVRVMIAFMPLSISDQLIRRLPVLDFLCVVVFSALSVQVSIPVESHFCTIYSSPTKDLSTLRLRRAGTHTFPSGRTEEWDWMGAFSNT